MEKCTVSLSRIDDSGEDLQALVVRTAWQTGLSFTGHEEIVDGNRIAVLNTDCNYARSDRGEFGMCLLDVLKGTVPDDARTLCLKCSNR